MSLAHSINTPRLSIRSVDSSETKQYGAINELSMDEENLSAIIQGWNERGAI